MRLFQNRGKLLAFAKRLVWEENGQVGDAGTIDSSADAFGDSQEASSDEFGDAPDDTTGSTVREYEEPDQEQQYEQPEQMEEESFVDPSSLPPELKAHWGRMHKAYTQALERVRGVEEKAGIVDRFTNDPQFAAQTVAQWAMQHGIQFAPQGQQQGQRQGLAYGAVPQQIVESMRQQLKATTPELEWMAPSLAPAMWAAIQQAVAPLAQAQLQSYYGQQQERQQQQQLQQQEHYNQQLQTYEQITSQLSESHPGWEEREEEMTDMLDFFTSPELYHPQYGSKVELLFDLVTGGSAATQKAVRRMNDATRLRAGSGQVGRSASANVSERVRNASSRSDAFRIAGEAAIAQLG